MKLLTITDIIKMLEKTLKATSRDLDGMTIEAKQAYLYELKTRFIDL